MTGPAQKKCLRLKCFDSLWAFGWLRFPHGRNRNDKDIGTLSLLHHKTFFTQPVSAQCSSGALNNNCDRNVEGRLNPIISPRLYVSHSNYQDEKIISTLMAKGFPPQGSNAPWLSPRYCGKWGHEHSPQGCYDETSTSTKVFRNNEVS